MSASKYRFIIVDDDKDVRLLIRDILDRVRPLSMIFEAGNGQEALDIFESHGADFMIIDHHIPVRDGLSLVRYLRAQNVKIPLVMISNNPLIEEEAPRAGATHFISKLKLCESLEQWLPGQLA